MKNDHYHKISRLLQIVAEIFKSAHISAMNCNKELIYGDGTWTLFMMLFPNILSFPTISQIHSFSCNVHESTVKMGQLKRKKKKQSKEKKSICRP